MRTITAIVLLALLPTLARADILDDAAADLKARAAWTRAQIAAAEAFIAKHPPASRPVFKTRDGRIAPDPRPTPGKALDAAKKLADKIDPLVTTAIESLKPFAADPEKLARQQTIARTQVNEAVSLVLAALVDTEYKPPLPAWLGGLPRELDAASSAQLDKELAAVVWASWQIDHPDGAGGMGIVGAGGKESGHSFLSGQKIGTLVEVISPKVSFRVSPKAAANGVTPTTPTFTLELLRPLAIGGATLNDHSLLERRLSTWFSRPATPKLSAATSTSQKK